MRHRVLELRSIEADKTNTQETMGFSINAEQKCQDFLPTLLYCTCSRSEVLLLTLMFQAWSECCVILPRVRTARVQVRIIGSIWIPQGVESEAETDVLTPY